MSFVTRGFGGRGRTRDDRLPPGQTAVDDWPVLSAGATPVVATKDWELTVVSGGETVARWGWQEFLDLGVEDVTVDIHCVTHWSRLAMRWRGVPLDAVLADVETADDYVMAHCFGGYTTNVAMDDLLDGRAWIAVEADDAPLTAEHGGPARLLVPHLYFWKSAKWLRSLETIPRDEPGFWEQRGYHMHGDPWTEERYW
jgi:DMSO/TMAO reductase YedYZ molybdopterin-dependent catalytic subunit